METLKNPLCCFFAIAICVASFYSCQKDISNDLNGSVVFKIQTDQISNLKSLKAETIAAAVIVSIKNGNQVIFDKEKLELSYLNGTYLSKGLSLHKGNYQLSEFLITDANNEVLYAAPVKGSALAQLVKNPLPLDFNIEQNSEIVLTPEVILAENASLEDFGYIGFSFHVVKSLKFLLTVYSKNDMRPLDSCNLSVTSPSGKNYMYLLTKSMVNPILVKTDSGKFVVTVSKFGYKSVSDTLTEAELKSHAGEPLHVVLFPIEKNVIWFKSERDTLTGRYFGYKLTTSRNTGFWIDWGNGTSEKVTTTNYSYTIFKRDNYKGDRLVQVWGDLKSIQKIDYPGPFMEFIFRDINIHHASNLLILQLNYAFLSSLNLTNLDSLRKIHFFYGGETPLDIKTCPKLDTVILDFTSPPAVNVDGTHLKFLWVMGGTPVYFGNNSTLSEIWIKFPYLNTTTSNALYVDLLKNVQSHSRPGTLRISHLFTESAEGANARKILVSDFHWNYIVGFE